ncbi:hypothetical protein D1007_25086 [Hordeum vulgare]|nr:hypothetical protein D1007_25086 [Hordeum vulgare]
MTKSTSPVQEESSDSKLDSALDAGTKQHDRSRSKKGCRPRCSRRRPRLPMRRRRLQGPPDPRPAIGEGRLGRLVMVMLLRLLDHAAPSALARKQAKLLAPPPPTFSPPHALPRCSRHRPSRRHAHVPRKPRQTVDNTRPTGENARRRALGGRGGRQAPADESVRDLTTCTSGHE